MVMGLVLVLLCRPFHRYRAMMGLAIPMVMGLVLVLLCRPFHRYRAMMGLAIPMVMGLVLVVLVGAVAHHCDDDACGGVFYESETSCDALDLILRGALGLMAAQWGLELAQASIHHKFAFAKRRGPCCMSSKTLWSKVGCNWQWADCTTGPCPGHTSS